jgi:hypothetical protein
MLVAIRTAAARDLTGAWRIDFDRNKIVVIEGDIENVPRFYGPAALVANVRTINATRLQRGTAWVHRDLDI